MNALNYSIIEYEYAYEQDFEICKIAIIIKLLKKVVVKYWTVLSFIFYNVVMIYCMLNYIYNFWMNW